MKFQHITCHIKLPSLLTNYDAELRDLDLDDEIGLGPLNQYDDDADDEVGQVEMRDAATEDSDNNDNKEEEKEAHELSEGVDNLDRSWRSRFMRRYVREAIQCTF